MDVILYKIHLNKALKKKQKQKTRMPEPPWILLRGLLRAKALCRNEAGTDKKTQDGTVNKNTDLLLLRGFKSRLQQVLILVVP